MIQIQIHSGGVRFPGSALIPVENSKEKLLYDEYFTKTNGLQVIDWLIKLYFHPLEPHTTTHPIGTLVVYLWSQIKPS